MLRRLADNWVTGTPDSAGPRPKQLRIPAQLDELANPNP
jgi:hypothetical protein